MLSTVHPAIAINSTPVLDGTYNSNVKAVRSQGATNPVISEIFGGRSKGTGKASGVIIESVDSTSNTITSAGFTIQNKKGSVHLSFSSDGLLSHSSNKKGSREVLSYTVDLGTGAYANATGSGTFSMSYVFKSGAVVVKLHSL